MERLIRLKIYLYFLSGALLTLTSCEKKQSVNNVKTDIEFSEPTFTGNTFYIDPLNGSANGDGSTKKPWLTLQQVIEDGLIQYYSHNETYNTNSPLKLENENAPVKGGDKLVLYDGYHGNLSINNFIFKDWLTIEAAKNQKPVFSQINVTGAFKNIYFKNLTILKDSYLGVGHYWDADAINRNNGSCLYLASNDFWGKGSNVKINGLTIKTTEDISSWQAADWVEKSASGIVLRSVENVEIYNCNIENVHHGIAIEYFSDHTSVVNNTIKNYSGDGARIISNDVIFAYNTISGCFKVDDNHDDAIQSYTRGEDNSPGTGILRNIIIRGNLIIGILDKEHPLNGNPQGIGCFDGMFDNWIVENNVIITNHYHGISFYGMTNSNILNNTVIDQLPGDDISPWIMITDHKNGTRSENCLVANNIVSAAVNTEGNDVFQENNYVFGKENYDSIYQAFANPDDNNFKLTINYFTRLHMIDKGRHVENMVSSDIDKDQVVRKEQPDLGAYESR